MGSAASSLIAGSGLRPDPAINFSCIAETPEGFSWNLLGAKFGGGSWPPWNPCPPAVLLTAVLLVFRRLCAVLAMWENTRQGHSSKTSWDLRVKQRLQIEANGSEDTHTQVYIAYAVPPKFHLFWITLSKINRFLWFLVCWILRKFDMDILQICPPDLSDVATLPWEIRKSHFSTLLFIYVRLFTLAQKKTNSIIVVVTLNICCDVACLTFQGPHITTGSFQSHRRQSTTGWRDQTFERTQ